MLGCLAALALSLAATPALAPAATVATLSSPSVREYGGTIVFSQYDTSTMRWYLAVREKGKTARRLNVASGALPFDADIGTDTKGRPELIYQRCDHYESKRRGDGISIEPTGCDLYVYSLATASGERPVSNANDPANEDVEGTLWNGNIAWVRYYDSGPVVYTKSLTAPRSKPSTRLPGVPQQRCNPDLGEGCATTADRHVSALELWGQNLAMVVRYICQVCSGISTFELRLDDVQERSASLIQSVTSGLASQLLTGPSFADGQLGWYRACGVREPACRRSSGPYRYRLSKRTTTRAPGPIVVNGFADAGSRLYVVLGCRHNVVNSPVDVACRIDDRPAPSYH